MQGDFDCLVLTGPTAVGKTASLIALQEALVVPLEVISADAFQVYRGLDIGTAKPDAQLLSQIPHHLIDILDIRQQFSVADFVHAAQPLMREIRSRGALPVVCGGTVYYIKHLLWGLPETPPADSVIRQAITQDLATHGAEWLHQQLAAVDPVSASRIAVSDSYRVSRALEVWQGTGQALSSFERQTQLPQCNAIIVGLERERTDLVQRIEQRVDTMLDLGLSDEIRQLLIAGFSANDPGMRAIGYKEFLEAKLDLNHLPQPSEIAVISQAIKIHSRQYAKRQMTFLRGLPNIHWLPAGKPQFSAKEINRLVRESLSHRLT